MTERTNPSVERFIEQLGNLAVGQGNSRTFGRIFALLMTADEPVSFSEIAERLELSRGGVSMNTRSLIELGLIDRVNRPGDRQDYFELPENLWRKLFERQMQRDRDLLDAVTALTSTDGALPERVRGDLMNLAMSIELSLQARRAAAEAHCHDRTP